MGFAAARFKAADLTIGIKGMRNFADTRWSLDLKATPLRLLQLGVVVAGVALALSGAARAQEDEQDDSTFEEKIISNIMHGLGGKSMEDKGIDYRERSPLVVPRDMSLPPPEAGKQASVPANWPKDPDEQARRASKKLRRTTADEDARPLAPAELNKGRTAAKKRTEPLQPGESYPQMLSPSQLGYNGGLLGMFKGNTSESAPFTGEPVRESLTQPPVGYQTPSPNYAYGTGPMQPLEKQGTYDVQTGKEIK